MLVAGGGTGSAVIFMREQLVGRNNSEVGLGMHKSKGIHVKVGIYKWECAIWYGHLRMYKWECKNNRVHNGTYTLKCAS